MQVQVTMQKVEVEAEKQHAGRFSWQGVPKGQQSAGTWRGRKAGHGGIADIRVKQHGQLSQPAITKTTT